MGEELLWAVKNGDEEQVKTLLQKTKFNVNTELLNGRMALHYAADYGQVEVVKLLLDSGADVNLPDKHGITPLLAAIYEGHVEVVKILVEKGANKSGKAPDGSSYYEAAEIDEIKTLLK